MDQYIKVPVHENEKKSEIPEIPTTYGYGVRHLQVVIGFFCLSTCFAVKGHLGVTIVAMTSNRTLTKNTNGTDGNLSAVNISDLWIDDDTKGTIYRTYNWPKSTQETILASFFLGYFIMMIPMAMVCQRWGGIVPLQVSLLVNGLVSLVTPWVTLWGGWKAMCACRILQGLSQAGTFPGLQTLLAKWVPFKERATMTSYVYTGTTVGNVIGFQVSGILASSTWGWPSAFWAFGVLCFVSFSILTIFGASAPLKHKTITEKEIIYIMGENTKVVRKTPLPWKAILASGPVWANFATHVGSGISFIFFLTQVPSYIHYIFGINVKNSGMLTSLPYIASFFTSLAFGIISDYVTNKKIISVKNARRICNSISQVGVAICLICASFASSTTVAVFCLVLTMSCQMGMHSGWMLNHIDLSPNYSGTLMAFGNVLMNMGIMILPILVSNIVVDVRNIFQWRTMMFILAGLCLISNVIFTLFLSVELQPWNEANTDDTEHEDMKLESESRKQ